MPFCLNVANYPTRLPRGGTAHHRPQTCICGLGSEACYDSCCGCAAARPADEMMMAREKRRAGRSTEDAMGHNRRDGVTTVNRTGKYGGAQSRPYLQWPLSHGRRCSIYPLVLSGLSYTANASQTGEYSATPLVADQRTRSGARRVVAIALRTRWSHIRVCPCIERC